MCTFPSVVLLDNALTCDGAEECHADTLRAVKIAVADLTLYYSYEEEPFVHLTLFGQGQALQNLSLLQCADPGLLS